MYLTIISPIRAVIVIDLKFYKNLKLNIEIFWDFQIFIKINIGILNFFCKYKA